MEAMVGGGVQSLPEQLAALIASVDRLTDAMNALREQRDQPGSDPAGDILWDIVNADPIAPVSMRVQQLLFSASVAGVFRLNVGNSSVITFYAGANVNTTIPLGKRGYQIGRGQRASIDNSLTPTATFQATLEGSIQD